jgi:hypothetical protein
VTDEHAQVREVCRWNRQLAEQNAALCRDLRIALRRVEELESVSAALHVEAEVADALLGVAMDAAGGGAAA